LAADVGNTRIALGAVRGEEVYVCRELATSDLEHLPAVLSELWEAMDKPRRIVACSVNPAALETLKAAAVALEEPVAVIGDDIPLPIATALGEPEKIGTDRLCCAAAAFQRLGQACVVVDAGTAVTIDCVSDEGVFLGGAILPGMKMQAAALHAGAAQLPAVELTDPSWVFGGNTAEAITGGIVYGLRGAVRERVEAYATELRKWPLVILTGGDAELLGMDKGIVQAVVPQLCLIGIAGGFYHSLLGRDDD
jgi:type III pantothenate kinase